MPSSPSHPRRSLALDQSNPHCGLMGYQNMSLRSPYFRRAFLGSVQIPPKLGDRSSRRCLWIISPRSSRRNSSTFSTSGTSSPEFARETSDATPPGLLKALTPRAQHLALWSIIYRRLVPCYHLFKKTHQNAGTRQTEGALQLEQGGAQCRTTSRHHTPF